MNDLEQAFIRAYEKTQPVPADRPEPPAAGELPVEPATSLSSEELRWLGVEPTAAARGEVELLEPDPIEMPHREQVSAPRAPGAGRVWSLDPAAGAARPHFDLAQFFRPTLVAAEGTLPAEWLDTPPPAPPARQEPSPPKRPENRVARQNSPPGTPPPPTGAGHSNHDGVATSAPPQALGGQAAARQITETRDLPAEHDDVPLRAVWQVERVAWPETCERLARVVADELARAAQGLAARATRGQRMLALASARSGEGRTTLLLTLGRQLARLGASVLLVDADFLRPSLAFQLSLSLEVGLEDWLAGRLPLDEVLIESIGDRLHLLPLVGPLVDAPALEIGATAIGQWQRLRREFDVVLIDTPALDDLPSGREPCWPRWLSVDAAIMIHDVDGTSAAELRTAAGRLAAAGVPLAGVVENHVAL